MWRWKDVSVQCAGCYFFLRSWQRRRRSEIGCYSARRGAAFHCLAWEMFEHWRMTEKQPVSTSLGVFHHEVARTDLPRKNLNEKTSVYVIVRELGERGSSSSNEESRVLARAIFFFWIFLSKLVRSWRRLICREMTGISRHAVRCAGVDLHCSDGHCMSTQLLICADVFFFLQNRCSFRQNECSWSLQTNFDRTSDRFVSALTENVHTRPLQVMRLS